MKRLVNNTIAIIIIVFIISGAISVSLISGIGHAVKSFAFSNGNLFEKFEAFVALVDGSSTYLSYEGICKDLYSLKLAFFDKKDLVEANGKIVVRMDNDYLNGVVNRVSDEKLEKCASAVNELYKKAEASNANFLYVAVPNKGMEGGFPEGIHSYINDNTERYMAQLENFGIPVLNIKEKMDEQGITEEQAFFVTDHHWIPEIGFWAAGETCNELAEKYKFQYDSETMDIHNYDIKVYKDWYLGSQGIRVGQFFSSLGADDISLIQPKFKTFLTVENPIRDEIREGDFLNSIIFQEKISKKSLYNRKRSAYAAYSGGDMAVQIIKNNLAKENAPKILVIRDSMAGCVTPYLSLVASELHTIDLRPDVVADPVVKSVYDYIDNFKPDYVLVIYANSEIDTESAFEFD